MESPGTAPGSDPLITSAFMFIVPRDTAYIDALRGNLKRQTGAFQNRSPYIKVNFTGKIKC